VSLRGGWMKVPAMSWEPVHYSAQWTPENPAPEWWAQFDLSWQIDRDDVMSERKLAAFLGWNRRSAVTLLEEVGAVLGIREPKASQKRATTRKVAVPEVSQSGTVESGELFDRGAKVEPEVSQVWAKSEPPRARAFPLPEADSEADPDSEKKQESVPPVPVGTLPPVPEPAPCAPPQAIPTSAPESTAKEATNTPLGLFNQGSADTVAIPRKPKKAAEKANNDEAIRKVWAQYRIHKPACDAEPTKEAIAAIGPALLRTTPENLMTLIRWAFDCQDEKGQHLWLQGRARGSERKYQGIGNLMVAGNIAERLEEAIPWAEGQIKSSTPAQTAPPEDPATIWESLIKRRSGGIKVLPEDIPPRTVAAIRAAGGWNQLGMLNDYTEKQARSMFISAYRNYTPISGHQRTA